MLPPERREAFVLTQVVGCSYEEAAAIAGVPVGTIRSRVARAREALVEAVRAADADLSDRASRELLPPRVDYRANCAHAVPATPRKDLDAALPPYRDRLRRVLAIAAVAGALLAALAAPASAHVSREARGRPQGQLQRVQLLRAQREQHRQHGEGRGDVPDRPPDRVRERAADPGLDLVVREDDPREAGQVRGREITEAVSKITWSGGEIKPGEFQLFTVSAGPLPTDTKQIEFKAVQTYSDGTVVRWIESTPKGGAEPEFPAPVLKLAGKAKSPLSTRVVSARPGEQPVRRRRRSTGCDAGAR